MTFWRYCNKYLTIPDMAMIADQINYSTNVYRGDPIILSELLTVIWVS